MAAAMSAGLSFLATLRAASEERPMPARGLSRAGNGVAILWLALVASAGIAAASGLAGQWPAEFAPLARGAALACAVAILPPLLAMLAGAGFGLATARSGWLHALVGRPVEALTVVPGMVLVALLIALGGAGTATLLAALSVALFPSVLRHMRLAVRDLHEEPWLEEARACGVPRFALLRRHVLPALLDETRALLPRLAIRALLIEATLAAGLTGAGHTLAWTGQSWSGLMARAPDPAALLVPALALTLTLLALSRLALVARRHQQPGARRRLGALWTGSLP
jgi:peptide/nickel transport system permease protein